MSDNELGPEPLKLKTNYSYRNNNRDSQSMAFQAMMNGDMKTHFILSFNSIPDNIEFITKDISSFLQFVKSYPGTAYEMADFMINEMGTHYFLEPVPEDKPVPIALKNSFLEYYGVEYTSDMPSLLLMIPQFSVELIQNLSDNKLFNTYYDSLCGMAFEKIHVKNMESIQDLEDKNFHTFFAKTFFNLISQEKYEQAASIWNINSQIINKLPYYQNEANTKISNLPIFKNFLEKYPDDTPNPSLGGLFAILAQKNPAFIQPLIDSNNYFHNNIFYDMIYLGKKLEILNKDPQFWTQAADIILNDFISKNDHKDESTLKEMILERKNSIALLSLNISPDIANIVSKHLGLGKSSTFLKKLNTTEDLASLLMDTKTISQAINLNKELLFYISSYGDTPSSSHSFFSKIHEKYEDDIRAYNASISPQDPGYWDLYKQSKPLSIEFFTEELKISEDVILGFLSNNPINKNFNSYTSNLDMLISMDMSRATHFFVNELILLAHPDIRPLYLKIEDIAGISDASVAMGMSLDNYNTFTKAHHIFKELFFRPANELEMKSLNNLSHISTITDNPSRAEFLMTKTSQSSSLTNNPSSLFKLMDRYVDALNLHISEKASGVMNIAESVKHDIESFVLSCFKEQAHYSQLLYAPEQMGEISAPLEKSLNFITQSGVFTEDEIFDIFAKIDNSTLMDIFYNSEDSQFFQSRKATHSHFSGQYKEKFINSFSIFKPIMTNIESVIMKKEVLSQPNHVVAHKSLKF